MCIYTHTHTISELDYLCSTLILQTLSVRNIFPPQRFGISGIVIHNYNLLVQTEHPKKPAEPRNVNMYCGGKVYPERHCLRVKLFAEVIVYSVAFVKSLKKFKMFTDVMSDLQEDAYSFANEVGYPCLLRPSYVLR